MQNNRKPIILTFEEIQERRDKVFSQEEWNDLEKWMDEVIESGKWNKIS